MKQGDDWIYLDYAGACPPMPDIVSSHAELCRRFVANPHAGSRFSQAAKTALLCARRDLLDCLGIPDDEADVLWVSGGTEADNVISQGILRRHPEGVCLVDAGAHPALLEPCLASRERGRVERIPLRSDGILDWDRLSPDVGRDACLVAVCHVNNETGVVQDLVAVRRWMATHAPKAVLAVDAVQSFSRIPIPWARARIDLMALSARKFGGPAGTGAVIRRAGVQIEPLLFGGGQQGGLRPGTVDVVGVVEMVRAAKAACASRQAEYERLAELNRAVRRHGDSPRGKALHILSPDHALPHILALSVPGYEGAVLMRLLAERNILVGTGSACSAESGKSSHVLKAMGYPETVARGGLRLSFGYGSTRAHVEAFLQALPEVIDEY